MSSDICLQTKPTIDPELLARLHATGDRSHYWRIWIFLVSYVAAVVGAINLSNLIGDSRSYLICLPLYLLAGASLHGISLFVHEGVHGVLHSKPIYNRLLSIIFAVPVGQNYSAYKVLHLQHHQHLGLPGDPDHYGNYTEWSWLEFLMHWGRLIIGYPVYLVAIPILGFQQGNNSDRIWIAIEVMLFSVIATALMLSPLDRDLLISGWLLPMLFINTMVNIRGMSQHTGLDSYSDIILGTRTILTNPVTRFFMCNENYHLEHHLYPGIPWYNLPILHENLKQELIDRGAPFIPSYFSFVREFVMTSFQKPITFLKS